MPLSNSRRADQQGKAWRSVLLTLAAVAAGAWAVWTWFPQWLPIELRRGNPNSADYAPLLYKWRDAQGRVQLTDTPPPEGVEFEQVRLDPQQNVIPGYRPQ